MERSIKIFKSFEEQEQYYAHKMQESTPLQRFKNLYRMQLLHQLLHPPINKARKITIQKHGHSQ